MWQAPLPCRALPREDVLRGPHQLRLTPVWKGARRTLDPIVVRAVPANDCFVGSKFQSCKL